ncbi:hypothetical protein BH11CYA1_BH11CYA1_01780 [soil metagenome]
MWITMFVASSYTTGSIASAYIKAASNVKMQLAALEEQTAGGNLMKVKESEKAKTPPSSLPSQE